MIVMQSGTVPQLKCLSYSSGPSDPEKKVTIKHEQIDHPKTHMGVSKNGGTPKSSILIRFSIINHPFWGTRIFGNIHIDIIDPKKKSRSKTLLLPENPPHFFKDSQQG